MWKEMASPARTEVVDAYTSTACIPHNRFDGGIPAPPGATGGPARLKLAIGPRPRRRRQARRGFSNRVNVRDERGSRPREHATTPSTPPTNNTGTGTQPTGDRCGQQGTD